MNSPSCRRTTLSRHIAPFKGSKDHLTPVTGTRWEPRITDPGLPKSRISNHTVQSSHELIHLNFNWFDHWVK